MSEKLNELINNENYKALYSVLLQKSFNEKKCLNFLSMIDDSLLKKFLKDDHKNNNFFLINVINNKWYNVYDKCRNLFPLEEVNFSENKNFEDWMKEPLFFSIAKKDEYIFNREKVYYFNLSYIQDAIIKNPSLSFLDYFGETFDLEGIKFVLKNKIEDFASHTLYSNKELSIFNTINTKEIYEKNKNEIRDIIEIILNSYKKDENIFGKEIIIKDIKNNIYSGVMLDFIKSMSKKFNSFEFFDIETISELIKKISPKDQKNSNMIPEYKGDKDSWLFNIFKLYDSDGLLKNYLKGRMIIEVQKEISKPANLYPVNYLLEKTNIVNCLLSDNINNYPELLENRESFNEIDFGFKIIIKGDKEHHSLLTSIPLNLLTMSLIFNNEKLFNCIIEDSNKPLINDISPEQTYSLKLLNMLPDFFHSELNKKERFKKKNLNYFTLENDKLSSLFFENTEKFKNYEDDFLNHYCNFIFKNAGHLFKDELAKKIDFQHIIDTYDVEPALLINKVYDCLQTSPDKKLNHIIGNNIAKIEKILLYRNIADDVIQIPKKRL